MLNTIYPGRDKISNGVSEMIKIYVRERQKVREGAKQPMFRIVAVTGGQVQIELTHFRKFEIEQIAKDIGAEVVYLQEIPDEEKKKA